MTRVRCPCCGGGDVAELARVGPVPVLCGTVWDSVEEARAARIAHLDLVMCANCGHAWNRSFDPGLMAYEENYDNALDASETFSAYANGLAAELVETFHVRGGSVVEIGCGSGQFLRRLCQLGLSSGTGFDPAYTGPDVVDDVTFVREPFGSQTRLRPADLIVCRHVLEHVPDPFQFLVDIASAVAPAQTPVYLEVPNGEFNFAESGPWDYIYPHVSYFSESSLVSLLERANYQIRALTKQFYGQFLGVEAVPLGAALTEDTRRATPGRGRVAMAADRVADQLTALEHWSDVVAGTATESAVALWGAGSKGVTFLNLVESAALIDVVTDVNPAKWGRHLPSKGHRVSAPEQAPWPEISLVIVMNGAYLDEVQRSLHQLGGGSAEVRVA